MNNLSDERDRLDFADNAHRIQPIRCRLWQIVGYIGVVVVLVIVLWSQFKIVQ